MEVKKTIAKGLPPGWIREIRVTRTANRIRRDSVIDHLFPLRSFDLSCRLDFGYAL